MPVLLSAVTWFLSPIGRYVGSAMVILTIIGGVYARGRYDDHVAYTAQLTQEAADAVAKAEAARAGAEKNFDAHPVVPNPKPRHRSLRHPFSVRHDPDRFSRD